MRNKVLATFYQDCDESNVNSDNEVESSWTPINFTIYKDEFPAMIKNAMEKWIKDVGIERKTAYEVIFVHVIVVFMGAITDEYFEPLFVESQNFKI